MALCIEVCFVGEEGIGKRNTCTRKSMGFKVNLMNIKVFNKYDLN